MNILLKMCAGVLAITTFASTPATLQPFEKPFEKNEKIKIDETLLRAGYCETRLKHYSPDGSVMRGLETPSDTGMFQISLRYHAKRMEQLGLDPYALSDNAKYAELLFESEGATPWRWSYNPKEDQCKNGVKLPKRESEEWRSAIELALSAINAKLK